VVQRAAGELNGILDAIDAEGVTEGVGVPNGDQAGDQLAARRSRLGRAIGVRRTRLTVPGPTYTNERPRRLPAARVRAAFDDLAAMHLRLRMSHRRRSGGQCDEQQPCDASGPAESPSVGSHWVALVVLERRRGLEASHSRTPRTRLLGVR